MVVRIDPCLDALRCLIAAGGTNGISLAEWAIAEYWEGAPPRVRKSGLLYMQILYFLALSGASFVPYSVEPAGKRSEPPGGP
jgi:hypothetical protein